VNIFMFMFSSIFIRFFRSKKERKLMKERKVFDKEMEQAGVTVSHEEQSKAKTWYYRNAVPAGHERISGRWDLGCSVLNLGCNSFAGEVEYAEAEQWMVEPDSLAGLQWQELMVAAF
jgi:hypothetical protein